MTETNAFILDPEKLNLLIETLQYSQGAYERELQGLDHFLQGTELEMERHVRLIEEKKAFAGAELERVQAELARAEEKCQCAEAELQNRETQVANAGNNIGRLNEKLGAAYDNLNFMKDSMRGEYHPEYNEVIGSCWDVINGVKGQLNDAHVALNDAKQERDRARGAMHSAKKRVSECTSKRDRARNDLQKWTDRLPQAKDIHLQVRLLLENNYYATPSAFDDGGPDWKMTQMAANTIPPAIGKLQAILKAIEAYTGTPVSSLEPYAWNSAWEGDEDPPMTSEAMDDAVQAASDSIYTEIRKGFRPNPAPYGENMEVRCQTCGLSLKECRCNMIKLQ